jgi:hypothetical protein
MELNIYSGVKPGDKIDLSRFEEKQHKKKKRSDNYLPL